MKQTLLILMAVALVGCGKKVTSSEAANKLFVEAVELVNQAQSKESYDIPAAIEGYERALVKIRKITSEYKESDIAVKMVSGDTLFTGKTVRQIEERTNELQRKAEETKRKAEEAKRKAEEAKHLAVAGKRFYVVLNLGGESNMEMALQFEKDGKLIPARKVTGKWVGGEYDLTYKVTGSSKVTVYDDGKEDGGVTFPTVPPKKGDKIKFGPTANQSEATITKIEDASPLRMINAETELPEAPPSPTP